MGVLATRMLHCGLRGGLNMAASGTYESDFYAWTQEQAALLRAGRFAELDVEHIIEEIEDMGKSERRELASRLEVILADLLKWQYQKGLRSTSWLATIKEQRRRIARHLGKNRSLKAGLEDLLVQAYEDARYTAGIETGYSEIAFPAACPWTLEQVLDPDFLPE
jgi:ribosomal protein L29